MTGLLVVGVLSLIIFGILLVAAAAALPPQRLGPARCRPEEKSIALLRCWLSPEQLEQWTRVREFEEAFAARAGLKYAVAVNSCTAALHLGLIALGVGPGDEVVMPSLTFVAGAQCTLEIGAVPVFCDVDADTLTAGVPEFAAAITSKTRAIIAMPYAGRPMNVAALADFALERGIALIEDAAHAAGMLDAGEWAGTHSALAAYSFYATKNLTTAEGGVVLTNECQILERVRSLSLHGTDKDASTRYIARGALRYAVSEPGSKSKMPDIASTMGLGQL